MKRSIRLQDIAESLNLSISTVSKALKDSPEISQKTKDRVVELARLNHYQPNISAQILKGQNTRSIGVIMPSLHSKLYTDVLNAIEEITNSRNYRLILCISNEDYEKEIQCVDKLIQAQVDGIIICPSIETFRKNDFSHLLKIQDHGKALVLFDRIPEDIYCDKISVDEGLMAEELALELCCSGFKKIGFISIKEEECITKKAIKGYKDALRTNGLPQLLFEFKRENKSELEHLIYSLERNKIDALIISDLSLALSILDYMGDRNSLLVIQPVVKCLSRGSLNEIWSTEMKILSKDGKDQGKTAADIVIDRVEGLLWPEPVEFVLKNPMAAEQYRI